MGSTFSAQADAPPPMPNFMGLSPAAAAAVKEASTPETPAANYLDLPQPVRYEDMQREVLMALRPELFEGMRFEINRPLTSNIFLSHRWDVTDWLSLKGQAQVSGEPGSSQVMVDFDLKRSDWNAQLKFGNPNFYGLNYLQSITPALAVGGEIFWLQSAHKSGVGFAVRHNVSADKPIFTAQVATTGILSLQYAHKVGEKITLASDLLWNWNSRETTATVGYDCMLRQCRLRGKIDTNGTVSAYLEERFTPGINFIMSAELDHWHKNYKFGFGVSAGE